MNLHLDMAGVDLVGYIATDYRVRKQVFMGTSLVYYRAFTNSLYLLHIMDEESVVSGDFRYTRVICMKL